MNNRVTPPMTAALTLRQRAEASLRELPDDFEILAPEALRQMFHELRVHQAELEMQNEELRAAQLALDTAHARYFDFYDLAPVGYLRVNGRGLIEQANLTTASLLGLTRDALVKQPISRFILKADQDIYYRYRQQIIDTGPSQPCELRMVRADGTPFWGQLEAIALPNEAGTPALRIVLSDFSERKLMEEEIHQLAFYDPLTNLPNRRLLRDRLSQTMAANKRSACYGALMFLDLDNFKPLNDRYGHDAGDLLLIQAANRLRSCVREMDTVARFGGDEFVVVLSELNVDKTESTAQAEIVAEKILATVSEPYRLTIRHAGKADAIIEHHCTASIGITLFIDQEPSQEDILKWADLAMYQAKAAGGNSIRLFDQQG